MRLITPATIIAAALAASPVVAQTTKPQYVLISFDGAHDNKLWTRSRELAKNNNAHFTYFLSCVFLMERKTAVIISPAQACGCIQCRLCTES